MEKDFLNQKVEVLVSFAYSIGHCGATPSAYIGKIIDVDENYILMDVGNSIVKYSGNVSDDVIGKTAIRKDYIIYIRKIED